MRKKKYLVITSNIGSPPAFDTIQDALDFVGDQLEMGFECSIHPITVVTDDSSAIQRDAMKETYTDSDKE